MFSRPKKSLGQNFLIDKRVLDKIISTGEITKEDIVLEIGPGTGNLTKLLISKKPKKIIVIEKDNKLSNILSTNFKSKIEVVNKDILEIPDEFFKDQNFLIFGNLPYNISSQILANLCLNPLLYCSKLIFLFQKEVADRIIAKVNTKNYGRLSILSNWKFNIEKICDIEPSSFNPKPKVQSSLLKFIPKKKIQRITNPKNLEKITQIFFNERRKMIKKPVKILFKNKAFDFNRYNLNPSDRPQNIDVETYLKIAIDYEKSKLVS